MEKVRAREGDELVTVGEPLRIRERTGRVGLGARTETHNRTGQSDPAKQRSGAAPSGAERAVKSGGRSAIARIECGCRGSPRAHLEADTAVGSFALPSAPRALALALAARGTRGACAPSAAATHLLECHRRQRPDGLRPHPASGYDRPVQVQKPLVRPPVSTIVVLGGETGRDLEWNDAWTDTITPKARAAESAALFRARFALISLAA